jgi:glutamate-1-semialdehyde aminotransferase
VSSGDKGLAALLERERERFDREHPRSRELHERARESLLAGVPMSWMVQWAGGFPVYGKRAEGATIVDVDGNEYADFCLGDTGAMAGHSPEPTMRAIAGMRGITTMLPTDDAAWVGGELARRFGVPYWQFALTATDANRWMLRMCRHVTGLPRVAVFNWCYHGSVDEAFVTLDERGAARARERLVGPAVDPAETTRVVEFNELDSVERALGHGDVACLLMEPALTNIGIVLPEPGFLEGVRELCTRHGILMICDEVMAGFGRTGRWFAVDHWGVVPDLLTMAKGLSSAYVQLGAVGMRRPIADHFQSSVFYGGLTYNSHPLGCAAALATISVYEEDRLIENAERMGRVMAERLRDLADRHPSVGASRSLGLFGIVELVRNRRTLEPMAPFNGTSPEMKALGASFREHGLYTFVRWNTFFTNPPLSITEAELREGFAIIDAALTVTDAAVTG